MEGPSEKVGGAEVNSGGPQIAMPGPVLVRKALLPSFEVEAEEKFTCTIDRIVSKLQELPFLDSQRHNSHPFANLMGWQYIMGGRARAYDIDNRTLCLDYAFRITIIESQYGFPQRSYDNPGTCGPEILGAV